MRRFFGQLRPGVAATCFVVLTASTLFPPWYFEAYIDPPGVRPNKGSEYHRADSRLGFLFLPPVPDEAFVRECLGDRDPGSVSIVTPVRYDETLHLKIVVGGLLLAVLMHLALAALQRKPSDRYGTKDDSLPKGTYHNVVAKLNVFAMVGAIAWIIYMVI